MNLLNSALTQLAIIAAGIAGLVYLIRMVLLLARKVDKLNDLTTETRDVATATHKVAKKELTPNGGSSVKDQIDRMARAQAEQQRVNVEHDKANEQLSAALADLTSRVQTAVVLAQQAVEGQERIEEQVAGIDTRLEDGEKRFKRLDRVTTALETVAKTNHPEDYPAGPDIED